MRPFTIENGKPGNGLELELAEMQHHLRLAMEAELKDLFGDCELGAIPPLGPACGMATLWDESLENAREVYFEALRPRRADPYR